MALARVEAAGKNRGAAVSFQSDPRRFALLLERLDATVDLRSVPVDEACGVIGDLLARPLKGEAG